MSSLVWLEIVALAKENRYMELERTLKTRLQGPNMLGL